MIRGLAWVAVLLLVVYLVFLGGAWLGIYLIQLRVWSVLAIAIVLASWAAVAVRRPAWRPATVLWPAFAAALTAFAIGEIASRQPRLGADYLAYAVLLTALYLLLQRLLASPWFGPRLAAAAVALCLGIGAVYLAGTVGDWLTWWSLVGRLTAPPLRPSFAGLTFGNPSAVMTMVVLLFAAAAAHLGFHSPGRRAVVAALALMAIAVTIVSGSRAGWLGLAIALGVTAVASLLIGANRDLLRVAWRSTRVRASAAIVALGGVAAAAVFGPGIVGRALAGGEDLRLVYYAVALRLFGSSPIVGTGPGTWVANRILLTQPNETDYYIPHAHDLYLQTLAEFGLLGAAAGVVVVVCLAWLIRDAIRDASPTRRRYGWAALFGTTYFAAHQLLDFYANMPAALFAFAIPIAWLDATARRPIHAGLQAWTLRQLARVGGAFTRVVAPAIGTVVIVASVAWLAWSESVATEAATGVAAADAGNWDAALISLKDAPARDPAMPPYQLALGIAAANAGQKTIAAAALERAAFADGVPLAWLDLAAIRLDLGDTSGARAALHEALRVGRQQPGLLIAAAGIDANLGDGQAAVAAIADAVVLNPAIAGAATDAAAAAGGAATWQDAIDEAIARLPPARAFDAALSSGQVDRAAALATQVADPATRLLLGDVVRAWAGDAAALRALEGRAADRPFDAGTAAWCSRVNRHLGDLAAAQRYATWVTILQSGQPAAYRIEIGPEATGPVGLATDLYAPYTYRRSIPSNQVLLELPHLVER